MGVKRLSIQTPISFTSRFMSTWMANSTLPEMTETCFIVELDLVLGSRCTDFDTSNYVDKATETLIFPG
jgi:hypothetical protein